MAGCSVDRLAKFESYCVVLVEAKGKLLMGKGQGSMFLTPHTVTVMEGGMERTVCVMILRM